MAAVPGCSCHALVAKGTVSWDSRQGVVLRRKRSPACPIPSRDERVGMPPVPIFTSNYSLRASARVAPTGPMEGRAPHSHILSAGRMPRFWSLYCAAVC